MAGEFVPSPALTVLLVDGDIRLTVQVNQPSYAVWYRGMVWAQGSKALMTQVFNELKGKDMSRFAPQQAAKFTPKSKPFAWSYSRLKNFEACPFKHQQVDILKNFNEDENEAAADGKFVHDAFAAYFQKGTLLPSHLHHYNKWIEKVIAGYDRPGTSIHAELQLAMTQDFQKAPWFADARDQAKPWMRGVIDFLKLVTTSHGTIALAVDWKTGKMKEDIVQLALFAQLIFIHFPEVVKVRTEYVWLEDDCTTSETFSREDMPDLWAAMAPRIEAYRHAYETNVYEKRQSGLCKRYCIVKSCENCGSR